MENIYKTNKSITLKLLCHTSKGIEYIKGNYYESILEPVNIINEDTNHQKCTLIWIRYNNDRGNRFTVSGNIYKYGNPYWTNFKKFFYCPVYLNRKRKLKNIKNNIKKINTKINEQSKSRNLQQK